MPENASKVEPHWLDDPNWLVVVDEEHSAEDLREIGVPAVALTEPHRLDVQTPRGPDSEVLLVGPQAQRIAGDLRRAGVASTWGVHIPLGYVSISEFLARAKQLHGPLSAEDLREVAWRPIQEQAFELPDSMPSGHPDAPKPGPSTTRDSPQGATCVGRTWRPLVPGLLSTTPPPRRWLVRQPTLRGVPCLPNVNGDGLIPRGRVGNLSAEGGCGKTQMVVQLAVSLVTGRPWLGYYPVEAASGRVLLALGEEDSEEVHRRLHAVAEALKLTPDERAAVEKGVVVLPLSGWPCGLLEEVLIEGGGREIVPSAACNEMQKLLREHAGEGGWSLVVLDPQARFGGVDVEGSNPLGTRWVQLLESLTTVAGNPTVMTVSHSSKFARRLGTADTRGVTALVDGPRWVATLTADGDTALLTVTKSNYSPPVIGKLRLQRGDAGVLTIVSPGDEAARATAEAIAEREGDVDAAVLALLAEGTMGSVDAIGKCAGLSRQRGRDAVHLALARGRIVRGGSHKFPRFTVAAMDASRGAPEHAAGESR